MAFTAKLYVPGETDGRAAERLPLDVGATLRDAAALAHDATVHDLSATGCLIETGARLATGTRVSIGIAGIGRIAATVIRDDGGRLGCAFDRPVDPARAAATGADNVVSLNVVSPHVVSPNLRPMPAAPAADDDRWPARTRLAVLVGGSIASWAMVIGVARLI